MPIRKCARAARSQSVPRQTFLPRLLGSCHSPMHRGLRRILTTAHVAHVTRDQAHLDSSPTPACLSFAFALRVMITATIAVATSPAAKNTHCVVLAPSPPPAALAS